MATGRPRPGSRSCLVPLGVVLSLALLDSCARPRVPAAVGGPPQRVEVRYANGVVQGGVGRVAVALGRPVELVVSSDVGDEVHLHGYDREADVAAGGAVASSFLANRVGVFEAELESRRALLVQFEVR
jgi:hypothetical protein